MTRKNLTRAGRVLAHSIPFRHARCRICSRPCCDFVPVNVWVVGQFEIRSRLECGKVGIAAARARSEEALPLQEEGGGVASSVRALRAWRSDGKENYYAHSQESEARSGQTHDRWFGLETCVSQRNQIYWNSYQDHQPRQLADRHFQRSKVTEFQTDPPPTFDEYGAVSQNR
jgi:hypothetical protein